ncbi:MAG: hypothetical protein AB7E27_04010 [Candidatus Methanomethylophilaceae archaeon]
MIEILSIILALLALLLLPGLVLSFAIYLPGERILGPEELDQGVGRLLLSVGLSLMLVPGSTYLLNYFLVMGSDQGSLNLVLVMSLLIGCTAMTLRLAARALTSR